MFLQESVLEVTWVRSTDNYSMSTETELLALCDLNWPHSLVSLSVFVISPKEQSPPRTPSGNVCVSGCTSLCMHTLGPGRLGRLLWLVR